MEIWKNLCNLTCKNVSQKNTKLCLKHHIFCRVLLLPCNAKIRTYIEFWQIAYPIWLVNIPPQYKIVYEAPHFLFCSQLLSPCNAVKEGYRNLANCITSLTFKYVSWKNAELYEVPNVSWHYFIITVLNKSRNFSIFNTFDQRTYQLYSLIFKFNIF